MDKLTDQWKSSLILRLGTLGIIVVLVLNGILDLRQAIDDQIKRQQQLIGQIAKSQRYANDKDWPILAEKTNLTLVELESRLWRSPTAGLAQAALNDWLTGTIKTAGLTKAQIDITQDTRQNKESADNITRVGARMTFEFTPATLAGWLGAVEQNSKQIIIERLLVRRQPIPRVEAQIVAPFRIDPPRQESMQGR